MTTKNNLGGSLASSLAGFQALLCLEVASHLLAGQLTRPFVEISAVGRGEVPRAMLAHTGQNWVVGG